MRGTTILAGCVAALALPAAAVAHDQHGGTEGHLPGVQENIDLVGEAELTGQFGDVVPGQIADVAVHKGYAYLNSWDEPSCTRGGTYVVDISDPANPEETGFIPAVSGYYHGEGAHVVDLDTKKFSGDLLAVNDETCTENLPEGVDPNSGGFDLYDVSDPENPVTLSQLQGDSDVGDPANSYHSVFVWQHDKRAYLVASDNTELTDVDIFDITKPTKPKQIGDFDLVEEFPQIQGELANGNLVLNHDMVVKQVGDQMRMLVSYWDAGYVQLDVTNPKKPTYITDTSFDDPDPLLGFDPPEGNAHQAEYSHDNEFFLAADEDFSPERLDTVEITTGANAGDYPGNSVGGAAALSTLPDGVLNGPTVYGGYGCDASAAIPPRATSGIPATLPEGQEAIIVLQRGPDGNDPAAPEEACFPGEKAENGINAGYDAVLFVNHHAGEAGGVFCGSGDFPATPPIAAACTSHEAFHHIFGTAPTTEVPYNAANEPAIGALGEEVSVEGTFDGWGYAHLYNAETSEEIDAFAIPESLDENFAAGFGDLSIHEFATDPEENIAYSSYYSGGVRVFTFGEGGLEQTGAFIDEEGSNFWGIEQFTTESGERLIAGSDRDFGLQIFRYTGPTEPSAAGAQAQGTNAVAEADTTTETGEGGDTQRAGAARLDERLAAFGVNAY